MAPSQFRFAFGCIFFDNSYRPARREAGYPSAAPICGGGPGVFSEVDVPGTNLEMGPFYVYSSFWVDAAAEPLCWRTQLCLIYILSRTGKNTGRAVSVGEIKNACRVRHAHAREAIDVAVREGWMRPSGGVSGSWCKKWAARRLGKRHGGLMRYAFPADIWSDADVRAMPARCLFMFFWACCQADAAFLQRRSFRIKDADACALLKMPRESLSDMVNIAEKHGWLSFERSRTGIEITIPENQREKWGRPSGFHRSGGARTRPFADAAILASPEDRPPEGPSVARDAISRLRATIANKEH